MSDSPAGEREAVAARLLARAQEAGIVVPPERLPDTVEGAGRLREAALRVRRFLAEAGEKAPA